jgi:gliding motility-associated-like protein
MISNNVLINDYDESGDPVFNPIPLDSTDHGQLIFYTDGSFDYIPNEGFVGIDSFQYEIYDVGIPSLSDTAWVYIDVYCTEENPDPLECELFVPEGFSPNGDGIHDFFRVMCIHLYPDAVMRIFNRNGNLLWMKEHYGNFDVWGSHQDAWWWGNTDYQWDQGTRAVLNQPGKIVKVSNYVWVLDLGNGEIRNGTVMVAY